jgi:hypothetical protein
MSSARLRTVPTESEQQKKFWHDYYQQTRDYSLGPAATVSANPLDRMKLISSSIDFYRRNRAHNRANAFIKNVTNDTNGANGANRTT